MDRGAWWATVHGVSESWTQLMQLSTINWVSLIDQLVKNPMQCRRPWFVVFSFLKNVFAYLLIYCHAWDILVP